MKLDPAQRLERLGRLEFESDEFFLRVCGVDVQPPVMARPKEMRLRIR